MERPSRAPARIKGEDLAGAGDGEHQPAADEEAARVLLEGLPDADRLGGVVLVEQLDAGRAARAEAVAEGAGEDDVAAHVLRVEQAGVAGEGAVGVDLLQVEGGELVLGVGHGSRGVRPLASNVVDSVRGHSRGV
jgi:hypothetical protein